MKKHNLPLVLIAILLMSLYIWFFSENFTRHIALNRKPLDIGSAAPGFSLHSSDGVLVDSSSLFQGNKTILYFFSPYCQRCLDQLPYWFDLSNRYNLQRSLDLVGICDCNADDLIDFWEKTNINFRVLFDSSGINEMYHVTYDPTVFLIDEEGTVLFSSYEYPNEAGVKVVETILNRSE